MPMKKPWLVPIGVIAVAAALAAGQAQPPGPPAGQAPGAGRGGGFTQPDPLNYSDYTGWTSLFDGATLTGWDGSPAVWKVAGGAITATSTCENPVGTTYLIWQGGESADFELKAEMKGEGPGINSGIQYRSAVQAPVQRGAPPPGAAAASGSSPGAAAAGRSGGGGRGPQGPCPSGQPRGRPDPMALAKWNLIGPQFDFDGLNRYPGQYYQSGAPPRFIEAYRGQVVEANEGRPPRIIGSVGDLESLGGYVNLNNWNQIHLIARGHTLVHILNGHVMSTFIDNDPARFRRSGVIGLQIEGTGTISFRNIYLKRLDARAPSASEKSAAPPMRTADAPAGGVPGGASNRRGAEPLDFNDHDGWTSIFDGTRLTDWDGNPAVWHLDTENKLVWAESTCEAPVGTTYLIWKGGEPADFELKTEMKLEGNINSGFQYRSFLNPQRSGGPGGPAPDAARGGSPSPGRASQDPCPSGQMRGRPPAAAENRWNVGGYQFDFDYVNRYSGQVYEGGTGRGIIAYRGQVVRTESGKHPRLIASLGDPSELGGRVHVNDWNQVHIVARGNLLIHILNGHVAGILVDDDPTVFKSKGLLAMQIEALGKVSFRNVWLKSY
jgi:hypothetical protein